MTKLKGKVRFKTRKKARVKNGIKVAEYQKKLLSLIRKFNDPILSKKCDEVKKEEDVSEIVDNLSKVLKTTKDGVGIAASQIGSLKRIVALRFDIKNKDVKIMISPVISEHTNKTGMGKESCLSYPGIEAIVTRYKEIVVTYLDINLKEQKQRFEDFKARVVQHEIDHLDGICKVGDEYDRIKQEEISKK